MSDEIWKDILGFDDYQVSTRGRVRSYKRQGGGRAGKPHMLSSENSGRYEQVGLVRDGKQYCKRVHRLVLEMFIGPCPEGREGCHYDGDSHNNRMSNLRWGTKEENSADLRRHNVEKGKGRSGAYYLKRVVEQQRRLIRWHLTLCALKEIKAGDIQREVAKKYGIHESHLSRILNGKYKMPDELLPD